MKDHNHQPKLVQSVHIQHLVHGRGVVGRFNTWIALRITRLVGSMWMAYAFALLALISLPAALASRNAIIIVAWIAQTFLQLVLLPIIIVGQNVQQKANDTRAEADHATLSAVHNLEKSTNSMQETQMAILRAIQAQAKK